jgi:hypothetical protein
MSRKSEFTGTYQKPATMYLEWSSDEKCFKHYNKDTKENDLIPLPLTFLVLKEMHTVKGWHDKSQSGIYSNEVKNIGKEEIEVKAFKGGTLCRGIYKEIKDIISNVGGRYVKSIYAMTKEGEMINIQLKGAAVQEWGETFNKGKSRLADEWVTVEGADDRKKGKVNYSVPIFKFDKSLTEIEGKLADEVYDRLEKALSKDNTPSRVEEVASDDDGDFSKLGEEELDF